MWLMTKGLISLNCIALSRKVCENDHTKYNPLIFENKWFISCKNDHRALLVYLSLSKLVRPTRLDLSSPGSIWKRIVRLDEMTRLGLDVRMREDIWFLFRGEKHISEAKVGTWPAQSWDHYMDLIPYRNFNDNI